MDNKIKMHERLDTINLTTPEGIDVQYLGYSGTLERIEESCASGHIRSSKVSGRFQLPEVGKLFTIAAETFDKNLPPLESMRLVSTSKVTKVSQDSEGVILFWTLNSAYRLMLC